MRSRSLFLVALLSLLSAVPAAAQVFDPAGDYLPSYTGPKLGDLDVLSVNFQYTATDLVFTSTYAGAVSQNAVTGAFQVWGVDRGAGTKRFSTLPGGDQVVFDSVLVIRPGGTSQINDLVGGLPSFTIDPSSILINSNKMVVTVPISRLPTQGFALTQYTANLWPRYSLASDPNNPVGNAGISDFAPNNSNITVTAAPEPASLLLCLPAGLLWIKRRKAAK